VTRTIIVSKATNADTVQTKTSAVNWLHFSGANFWYVCHANLGPDSSGLWHRFLERVSWT